MIKPEARTISGLLNELAEMHPRREALVGGAARYTFLEVRDRSRDLAKGLLAVGVRHGDKVGILAGNQPEWLLADFAITSIGATMVGINTWATGRELEYVIEHADVSVLITADLFLRYDYRSLLAEIGVGTKRFPLLRHCVWLGNEAPPGELRFDDLTRLGRDVTDAALAEAESAVTPYDTAYLLYTSGSTSRPKGVELQHFGLIENMWSIGERMRLTLDDRLWMGVSLFWGFGCENALFAALTHGCCVVLQEHFEPGEALALIERERCSVVYLMPNMTQALLAHADRPRRDLSSLRTGVTIGTPEQITQVMELGAREICNVYGLTEVYGNCAVTDAREPAEVRIACCGPALPGFEIRIVDPESHALRRPGDVGEIRVRGHVTTGYYKNSEQTALAFDADGFFRSGDLGYLDERGNLHFRGRIKEMIKSGGINIAPIEVEEVIAGHNQVHVAFVIGISDPIRDEVVAAVVVPKESDTVSEAELMELCRRSLAGYKVPRMIRIVDEAELPLTNTGKVQRNRLADLFANVNPAPNADATPSP